MFSLFRKKTRIEMCNKLAGSLYNNGDSAHEAREILMETIGFLDSAVVGMKPEAQRSDVVRIMLALPTMLNIALNRACKHSDTMEAFILTLEDMLETARSVSQARNNLRK